MADLNSATMEEVDWFEDPKLDPSDDSTEQSPGSDSEHPVMSPPEDRSSQDSGESLEDTASQQGADYQQSTSSQHSITDQLGNLHLSKQPGTNQPGTGNTAATSATRSGASLSDSRSGGAFTLHNMNTDPQINIDAKRAREQSPGTAGTRKKLKPDKNKWKYSTQSRSSTQHRSRNK